MVKEEKKKTKKKEEKHEHKEHAHEKKEEVHEKKHEETVEPVHEKKEHEKKAEPKKKRKKPAKKPESKLFITRGKRKQSIARATISEGKGIVRINSKNLASINNSYIREIIKEPLRYIGPEANNIDISVNVNGGGVMGQAQAARTAIANALIVYFDGMNLKEKFDAIDHSMVVDDTRRVESKKFRGPKARARFQKSYR
jgi:small subunit ribosomal protein S9